MRYGILPARGRIDGRGEHRPAHSGLWPFRFPSSLGSGTVEIAETCLIESPILKDPRFLALWA